MIEENQFIKFLSYIGIKNKSHQKWIYAFYRNGIRSNYRVSKLADYVEKYGYGSDAIIDYVIRPEYRKYMDEEVKRYGKREWSKDLKVRVTK